MNIGRGFSLAMTPIVVLIILAVITGAAPLIQFVLGLIPVIGPVLAGFAGFVSCCLGPGIFVLYIVALAGTGFYIGKAAGMDIADAAIVGAVAGALTQLIAGLAGLVVNIVGGVLGIANNLGGAASSSSSDALTNSLLGAFGAGAGIFATICSGLLCMAGMAVVGAVLAAVGFFLGGGGKK